MRPWPPPRPFPATGSEAKVQFAIGEVKVLPFVERSLTMSAPPSEVFAVVQRFEEFPEFMPDVKSVKVLASGDDWQESEWKVQVVGRSLRWVERDEFDRESLRITYRLTEGDLKKFEGEWRFEEVPEGTRVVLTVDFDLGIPMLAALLDPVLVKAVEKNSDSMLQAIKKRVEA